MKFLCSILILAGVFALNDAFPTYDEDYMRLAKDKLIIEDLKLMLANRDAVTSAQCAKDYLTNLSDCLDRYTTATGVCETTAEDTIKEINANATAQMKQFEDDISKTCASNCSADLQPADGFACWEEETSANSKVLSRISNQSATAKVEMNKQIEDTNGLRAVCNQLALGAYSSESSDIEAEFKKCAQGVQL